MKNFLKQSGKLRPIHFLFIVTVLCIPSFMRMLPPGLYSMQDFPYFRLVEYSKCLRDGQIPCRMALDAGLGYGEPVFNFYSHVPFFFGALLVQLGVSAISSLKFLFAFSLIGSGIGMFFLSKSVWKNNASALISAVLYVYAPYRAVNVWVRGALPESFAFICIPLILYTFEKYLLTKNTRWLLGFCGTVCLLILTHNLSILLFGPMIFVFILFRLYQLKSLKLLIPLVLAFVLSLLLSAFYLLPVIFESHFVNLQTTVEGYFNFRAHFVTLSQLFLSRFWGYGGSTWGDQDGLSLSIGLVQWIVGCLVITVSLWNIFRKEAHKKISMLAVFLVFLSLLFLLLTHNKSAFLWEYFSPVMQYIQFPWRFLGVSLFLLSLSAGYLGSITQYKNVLSAAIIIFAIILNYSFFREDLWIHTTDREMQSGETWIEESRASIGDYWPKYGPIPTLHASQAFPIIQSSKETSNSREYEILVKEESMNELPTIYFPGIVAYDNDSIVPVEPSTNGFAQILLSTGIHYVSFIYKNTNIRTIGNAISLFSLISTTFVFILIKRLKLRT
jgi:hypothetical protein